MRENMGIYRGKRTDNGEMVEGFYSCVTDNYTPKNRCHIITFKTLDNGEIVLTGNFEVIPETVGEYTGRQDIHGKKIFESDIVKAGEGYIFVVAFGKCGGVQNCENYGYMGFYLEALSEGTKACARYGLRNDICYFTSLEIIGNIHDTPEWLKEGAGNG